MFAINKQAAKIVEAFKTEACDALKIDPLSINIEYVSDIRIPGTTISNDNLILVNKLFLGHCITNKSTTPLRLNIYAMVRLIYIKREKISLSNLTNKEATHDSFRYASALAVIKGINLTETPIIPLAEIKDTIKSEFGLNGEFVKSRLKASNGFEPYYFRLDKNDTLKEHNSYTTISKSTVKDLAEGDQGSISNPFENINDAVCYLQRIEKEAYYADNFLQYVSTKGYFYDTNRSQFRITWAAPYVAHMKNDFPKHSFVLSEMAPLHLHKLDDAYYSFKPNLYGRKFLYRGQNYHYPNSPCVSNLFRDAKHNEARNYLDFLIFSQELELLMKSHPLIQQLEKGVEILHYTFKIRMHYPGLAQHYYNKSRFLDLTSDIDVMKFFATTGYDSKTDKYYPFKDVSRTGVIYYYELQFPEAFQQHLQGYALKTIGKQIFMRSGSQRGFLLDMEPNIDFKRLKEVKALYFKHDPEISEEIFKNSNEGQDYFAEDLLEHAWHNRMKQRFEAKVVSKKAVEYNVSLNSGETVDSITKKLNDRGITVDDYIPHFTEEEMSVYYQSIKDGWWDRFCDDIYFQGGDGELYREEMKNIPNIKAYQKAFIGQPLSR